MQFPRSSSSVGRPNPDREVSAREFSLEQGPKIKICTDWFVVTGAPCSGKTTLLESLAYRGLQITEEAARTFIDQKLSEGETLDTIWSNGADTVDPIHSMRLTTELGLRHDHVILLDKAIPDTIPYARMFGVDEQPILERARLFRYRAVFLCDQLPLRQDGRRGDDDDQRQWLEAETVRVYSELDYDLIRIPVMSVEKRAQFVLTHMCEQLDYDLD